MTPAHFIMSSSAQVIWATYAYHEHLLVVQITMSVFEPASMHVRCDPRSLHDVKLSISDLGGASVRVRIKARASTGVRAKVRARVGARCKQCESHVSPHSRHRHPPSPLPRPHRRFPSSSLSPTFAAASHPIGDEEPATHDQPPAANDRRPMTGT